MPVYAYQCRSCGFAFDARQSFDEDALRDCPQCGEPSLRKKYGSVGVTFKGSGFYRTDSAGSGSGAASGSGSGSGSSSSSGAPQAG